MYILYENYILHVRAASIHPSAWQWICCCSCVVVRARAHVQFMLYTGSWIYRHNINVIHTHFHATTHPLRNKHPHQQQQQQQHHHHNHHPTTHTHHHPLSSVSIRALGRFGHNVRTCIQIELYCVCGVEGANSPNTQLHAQAGRFVYSMYNQVRHKHCEWESEREVGL